MLIKHSGELVQSPKDVADILRAILKTQDETDQNKEMFFAIGLTSAGTIKYIDLVSLGTLDASLVHPREVFKTAIIQSVASIIIGHNHPSGSTQPSNQDISITRKLLESGEVLAIPVHDHILIAGDNFRSFREDSILDFNLNGSTIP